jgi:hypothetical protein
MTFADAVDLEGIVQLDEKFSYEHAATDTGKIVVLQSKNINLGYICDATSLYAVPIMAGQLRAFDATNEMSLRFKMIRD